MMRPITDDESGVFSELRITCQWLSPGRSQLQLCLREFSILDAMRTIRLDAKAFFALGFVVGIIALEPDHLAVAFERQDMRGHAVEEPAVVADDHSAAGEVFQGFFDSAD